LGLGLVFGVSGLRFGIVFLGFLGLGMVFVFFWVKGFTQTLYLKPFEYGLGFFFGGKGFESRSRPKSKTQVFLG